MPVLYNAKLVATSDEAKAGATMRCSLFARDVIGKVAQHKFKSRNRVDRRASLKPLPQILHRLSRNKWREKSIGSISKGC